MVEAKNCMKVRMAVRTRQTAKVFFRPQISIGYETKNAHRICPTREPMDIATCFQDVSFSPYLETQTVTQEAGI